VQLFLSDDAEYNPGVDQLIRSSTIFGLRAGYRQSVSFSYRLPTGQNASGKHVIAVVDPANAVVEKNELNNIVPKQIP
jgi:hypothetical protein